MSSRHSLYGSARAFYQWRIKRVRFRLDPLIGRTGGPCREDAVGKGLTSAVLCEDMNDSKSPPRWHELTPASFWVYLYSNSWADECSLRVVEGELLDMLLTALFTLETGNAVDAHHTIAFTRSRRVCRPPRKEVMNETLLIDFTYYGKHTPQPDTKTREEFLPDTMSTTVQHCGSWNACTAAVDRMRILAIEPKSMKYERRTPTFVDSGLLGIKGPIRKLPLWALANSYIDASPVSLIRSFGVERVQLLPVDGPMDKSTPLPSQKNSPVFQEKNTTPNWHVDKNTLRSDTKLLTFNLASESPETGDAGWNLDVFTSAHRPLGWERYVDLDCISPTRMSAAERLVSGKRKRQRGKEERRQHEIEERKVILEGNHQTAVSIQYNVVPYTVPFVKRLSHVPSFQEYIRCLESEHKEFASAPQSSRSMRIAAIVGCEFVQGERDATRRKNVASLETIAEEHRTASSSRVSVDGARSRFAEMVGGVTDSVATKKTLLTSDIQVANLREDSLPSPKRAIRTRPTKKTLLASSIRGENLRKDSLSVKSVRFSKRTESSREADSRDVRTHTESRQGAITPPKSDLGMQSLVVNDMHNRPDDVEDRLAVRPRRTRVPVPSKYSKTTSKVSQRKVVPVTFDTGKLNKRYSFENLWHGRRVCAAADVDHTGKHVFKGAVSFNGPLPPPPPPPPPHQQQQQLQQHQPLLLQLQLQLQQQQHPTAKSTRQRCHQLLRGTATQITVLGKLKKLTRLQLTTNHQSPVPELPDFCSYSMQDFAEKLLRALDDFVVRKEIVTSSYTKKTLTTVTFSRTVDVVRKAGER